MSTYEARLAALREQMQKDGLDGFVVPICDEHMSEYVGDYAQRLAWLTGFGGSAGSAVVLKDKAAIFTDGRYTIQVRDQVDGNLYEYVGTADQSIVDWLGANAPHDSKIGYDAWLHTQDWAKSAAAKLGKAGASLVTVKDNPLDQVWEDQPEPSLAKLDVQPDEFAGKSASEKRADIAAWLKAEGLDATVIAALDSVAWAFNIRGKDIANTPVPRGYAIVKADGSAELFVAPEKLTDDVRVHLGNAVALRDYSEFPDALAEYKGRAVGVDPERSVAAIFEQLAQAGANIVKKRDPTILAKAIKNETEVDGHKAAQARDGAALSQFLHWFSNEALSGGHDELSVAAKLAEFRGQSEKLEDLSFRTISGAGPNGALCHYSVNEETNRKIEDRTLYLVDSGGQYRDGTTDVTRTMAVGEPTAEMVKRYTQVLQGHIALAQAVFPKGTTGGQLDILARQYLWADGVDYAHGTGHGVGAYLSVHEGPQRIAAFGGFNEPLVAGMICSNEPGYYKTDEFGIRIENLILVEERIIDGAEQSMLGFETLTFAPLERRLIDVAMLSQSQRQWVDDYHAKVRATIAPQLDGDALQWLEAQTTAL
ncbi:aminopeptidase P family protein [Parasphingorhabdus sp.]|uniref:aminopeptidase P family protein n=1 Tax=Parasphingorhabdus sp. TaxID=2709688 RepID=UPI003266F244